MEIYKINYENFDLSLKEFSLVLGFFDGVHIGHKKLIQFAKENSKNSRIALLTFTNSLKNSEEILTTTEDKISEFNKLGVDLVLLLEADEKLKKVSHEDFYNKFLLKLNPKMLFSGEDFRFGFKALGDTNYLKNREIPCKICEFLNDENGNKVSSRNIKNEIRDGEIENANKTLGKEYFLRGKIVGGLHNGAKLLFPTANLELTDNYVIPKNGVYFTKIEFDGKKYPSVTNIGCHPTIEKIEKNSIETFIFDEKLYLYGKDVILYFYKYERDEKKFSNVQELKNQIEKDVENSKLYFGVEQNR